MEERALYRAILAAPHDDTARLVYADWLDENAERFPAPLAKAERARAEFIRVQCELARRLPFTPGIDAREEFLRYQLQLFPARQGDPEPLRELLGLARRQQRLLFTQGPKWRRAFHPTTASARFDRGFLRPLRAFTPQGFLFDPDPRDAGYVSFPMLPPDSPARRYLADDDRVSHFPLWDLHLYASDLRNDPVADRGQYGELLAQVGASPRLARVGTLQVTFFRTPCADFLRTGNFANVETLILNCGPFPEVLEAVAANESFRNLRYVQFGADRWSWAADFAVMVQHSLMWPKIQEANGLHLPYGEMRLVLRRILGEVGPMLVPPPPVPPPIPPQIRFTGLGPAPATQPTPPAVLGAFVVAVVYLLFLGIAVWASISRMSAPNAVPPPPVPPRLPDYQLPKMPEYQFDFDKYNTAKILAEHEKLMKTLEAMKSTDASKWLKGTALPPGYHLPGWPPNKLRTGVVPVAPPPREVVPRE